MTEKKLQDAQAATSIDVAQAETPDAPLSQDELNGVTGGSLISALRDALNAGNKDA